MSHTYSILDVTPQTYDEIREKLANAGYSHAFEPESVPGKMLIDMNGIALRRCDDIKSQVVDARRRARLRDANMRARKRNR